MVPGILYYTAVQQLRRKQRLEGRCEISDAYLFSRNGLTSEERMDFSGKNVLVTGASRGIGRIVAQQFAASGARVAIHYNRNRAAAEETLASLEGTGHILVSADMGSAVDVEQMVHAAVTQLERIHILVNNAGIFLEHRIASVAFDQWQAAWRNIIEVNLLGVADTIYLVARHMIAAGGGKIVNVSSRGAFRGEPHAPAYGASKAGLNAMSQSLAQALAPHNITVGVVAPGFVETDMAAAHLAGPEGDAIRNQSPFGRVAHPEEVARAVVFLASEGVDFLSGGIIDVNGASYLRS
jgi:NAD(P)-dependent dehydrogenase (short-subunit alcohol dehydrogenase family)